MSTTVCATARNIQELPAAVATIKQAMEGYTIFALRGQMGAGKTTFVNELMRQMGVTDDATGSPSFAIVNQYDLPSGRPVYHFDLYRLDDEEEVLDTGFTDYIDSGDICLIEWPDRAEGLLPSDTVDIMISVDPDTDARTITLTAS